MNSNFSDFLEFLLFRNEIIFLFPKLINTTQLYQLYQLSQIFFLKLKFIEL